MIIETLVVKGLVTAGHWLAAHGTSGLAAKGGTLVAKSIATHGLASTASTVTGGLIATGFVVGGVTWSKGLIDLLFQATVALGDGDTSQALKKFAELYKRLNPVNIKFFPDIVQETLPKLGLSSDTAELIGDFLRRSEVDILRYANLM